MKPHIKNLCPRSNTELRPSETTNDKCPYCWRDDLQLNPKLRIPNHSSNSPEPNFGFIWNSFLGR